MYGYVVPDKSKLSQSDFVLYRSFYCGLCCEIGKLFGQMPRFSTNYDFTFLAALLHDYAAADIVIEEHICILNPIKKKAVLQPNPLFERIAAANIMLSYKKAEDGVADGDGVKYRISRSMFRAPFKKAVAMCPDIWAVIEDRYKAIDEAESKRYDSIDRAADPFATLLAELPAAILDKKPTDDFRSLCYNIGKFVYLADALDDIADDSKRGRYNPFLARYGAFSSRKAFIEAHRADLEFIFKSVCARAGQSFNAIRFNQSYSLLRNIVFDGLAKKTEELLASDKKLPPPRI